MADQGTEGLLSPFLRRQRIKAAMPCIRGRVLDFGCGSGALAAFVPPESYVGVEIDAEVLAIARKHFPQHRFENALPASDEKFDAIISLAVIEHLSDPAEFLANLVPHLQDGSMARIVITTPHPAVEHIHAIGARIGLFSKHGNEEHKDLLNREKLLAAGEAAGLALASYSRFLFGANQLAIFERSNSGSAK